jgi:glycosyltransferase involved in cell wall biosynthesis
LALENTPLVSVLTPSFNQAAWLPENLRSVGCQSYPDIEHIIMDGASTDATADILRAADDSIRWASEPDRGQSHAINKAFAESRGEIIGWLNSDDAYFDCGVVADVVDHFAAHPEVDVVYGHCPQITGNGRVIQVLWVPPFDMDLLRALDFVVQPGAFIRRRALREPMVDETFHFGMDYELWLRLASEGRRFDRINRLVAVDRHQPDRKSSTSKDVYRDNLERLARMYEMRLGPEWESLRSAFYRRQRLRGALLLPRIIPQKLAFTAPADMKRGLLRRQVITRRSNWPEEYR